MTCYMCEMQQESQIQKRQEKVLISALVWTEYRNPRSKGMLIVPELKQMLLSRPLFDKMEDLTRWRT